VEYPVTLELQNEFLSTELNERILKIKGNKEYGLSAVVRHHGGSATKGHYTALCKDSNDMWREFDDSKVTIIDEADALAATKTAYLLFYSKLK
jgi:ubiquitin C-terminal hydrolase